MYLGGQFEFSFSCLINQIDQDYLVAKSLPSLLCELGAGVFSRVFIFQISQTGFVRVQNRMVPQPERRTREIPLA